MNTLLSWSAGVTMIIGCLGLFGLVAILAQQRIREVGIRKVLGASLNRLVSMLCRDFVLLVIGANVVAWPLAWWAIETWLEGFRYRVEVRLEWFVAAGLFVAIIALATVAGQAVKAARANPVDTLKNE